MPSSRADLKKLGPEIIKPLFMFNSNEHEISIASKK